MLASFAVLGLPIDAEVEFLFGSISVIAGWRFLYSNALPLP